MKKNKIFIYTTIIYIICFGLGIIALLNKDSQDNIAYKLLTTIFTIIPLIALFITRKITGDKSKFNVSLKVWKDVKMWLFCLIIPNIAIILGAIVYYLFLSNDFNNNLVLADFLSIFGLTSKDSTIISPFIAILITVILSIFLIPIHLLELGEELGWRGYLLPLQVKKYGTKKAILLNGLLWGIAHTPLIYFGFNYSLNNYLAPYSNIVMMIIFCIIIGIIESYVTIKTGNCMYAAIIHGIINITGEIPICFSILKESTLLGPNPSGLIGMIFFIFIAIYLFIKSEKLKNKLKLLNYNI